MSCFRPLLAYRLASGEVHLGLIPAVHADSGRVMELPCGRCIGCQLDRRRMWTVRIVHEAQLYDRNLFLTLTYDAEHLPPSLSLEYSDYSGFMKRLRRRLEGVTMLPDGRRPIRFFMCGEYGGRTGRPHYHAILFNADFPDKVPLVNGTYRSAIAEDLWKKGAVHIGAVTPRSAAYVAGYSSKKVYGRNAAAHYEDVVNLRTGELTCRRPEFVVMSRRPGIGALWYERFGRDLLPNDFAFVDGQKYRVPRYYMNRYRREADAGEVEEVLERRYERALAAKDDGTPERRAVREELSVRRQAFYGERGL